MSKIVFDLEELVTKNLVAGGKARSLSNLIINDINVPNGSVITGKAYEQYVDSTGLRGRILLELGRKKFEDMRWEELWDTGQRIRHMFNTTNLPDELRKELELSLMHLNNLNTVVRSSSIQEDGAKTSFAGLHDSYVNVKGIHELLEKIRLVWASLWSDSSLLYRQELGLSVEDSSMPVIVQEMIDGRSSGVVFSTSPEKVDFVMVEAVYGLCKGLVDGTIEPDRWSLNRDNLEIVSHFEPKRNKAVRVKDKGTYEETLNEYERNKPPLNIDQVKKVEKTALLIEDLFGEPQDIEWTIKDDKLFVVQARPITTSLDGDDIRSWYLSLKKSLDKLVDLERRITQEIIPEMNREAKNIQNRKISQLSDTELISEINQRAERLKHWYRVYWDEFIPMAHGARLFGQVYNDKVKPLDPHEFTELLSGEDLLSTRRNERMRAIAKTLRDNPHLKEELVSDTNKSNELRNKINDLLGKQNQSMIQILELLEKIGTSSKNRVPSNSEELEKAYFESFPEEERQIAEQVLRIGRRSWKLRDDDNIVLGKFENLLSLTIDEAKKRLLSIGIKPVDDLMEDEIILSLSIGQRINSEKKQEVVEETSYKPRQIVGQPASPGLVTGTVRVVNIDKDLFDFKEGEVLVCDAIDPNMTFIVPLASGIIERRGGMLIHGAIIAREYGIPCVTGIPKASDVIHTGDTVTVDGYLGIVTINKRGNL